MIKVVLTDKQGAKHLVIGLTYGNLAGLKAGRPIPINGAEIGFPGKVSLFAKPDANGVLDDFLAAGLIDEDQAAKMREYYRDEAE